MLRFLKGGIPALLIVFGLEIDGGTKAAALDLPIGSRWKPPGPAPSRSAARGTSAAAADSAAQAYLAAEDVAGTVTVTGDRVDVH